jgi:hypothetical protein
MSRTSDDKIVEDEEENEELKEEYIRDLERLKDKYTVRKDESYSNLVNFSENKEEAIHKWFDYKEGYSSELVRRLIEEDNLDEDSVIFDPFTGSGTTNVVAQQMGYDSVGVDILPISVLLARVKTYQYSEEELKEIKENISSLKNEMEMTEKVPEFRVLPRMFFSEEDKETMLKLKGFWENIENDRISDFFRLAYVSIIERVSNRKKDGNGIKYHRSKERVEDIISYYEDKLFNMYSDLINREVNADAEIISGSMLEEETQSEVKKREYSSVIFSPPYANCFDYCEVYKMEMWLGGFVEGYRDFDKYREGAVRSHVNSKFSHEFKHENEFVNTTTDLIGTYNIWNENIPDMIRGYFDDMTQIMKTIFSSMEKDAKCKIVVANSGYKGILVPTDLILAEIGEEIGFEVEEIIHTRDIRASSQQMKELHEGYDDLMRESILVLKKKEMRDLSQFTD